MEYTISSEKELQAFAENFIKEFVPREDGATVVALHGELGAGKTTFVQYVARVFGIDELVTSPTFVILKSYAILERIAHNVERGASKTRSVRSSTLHAPRFTTLTHIDAYRLESGEELKTLGWSELVGDPQNVIFIEWAERVKEILPLHAIHLSFVYEDRTMRRITLHHGEESKNR